MGEKKDEINGNSCAIVTMCLLNVIAVSLKYSS